MGSEMCIRDSVRVGPTLTGIAGPVVDANVEPVTGMIMAELVATVEGAVPGTGVNLRWISASSSRHPEGWWKTRSKYNAPARRGVVPH